MYLLTTVVECNCGALLPIVQIIKLGIIPIIQIGIPIILIILGMLDLGKAVMAGKEDEMKNAQKLLLKRAIYAVAVFFVVTIVSLVFGLLGNVTDEKVDKEIQTNWWNCWSNVGTEDGLKEANSCS